MFKWLHPYAKPEKAYQLSLAFQRFFMPLAICGLIVGCIWGLVFAPTDYQQSDSARIMYIHVPAAIWSMGVYMSMGIAGFCALVWQIKLLEISVLAMAPIGAAFTAIALFTGSLWGKPMWGTWWVWDARLTSELILLFLYMGVFALFQSFDDKRTGAKAACILAVIGMINVPIIHYSVEWWNTLHQGASITKLDKPSIAPSMLWPLLINIVSVLCLFIAFTCYRFATELLRAESHRKWVLEILGK
ncbi:cytochrome c-type biogenesis protein CcmC heme lyase for CcmE [Catenovulum agarivorans DS-2]|uniref:Heme exporter protein C n=1 Tax=Catenovulum agarivorans DS-2 TaxID=1328313 RepID=W7QGY9_9ALTE|nr:heme ABC transporter permease [Catenovulum agarivorans]EWH12209.1 cytochrome c-type biogenesis protein CcmC heme lyase for CcmE [Catenovulum agarivorans DS-2]